MHICPESLSLVLYGLLWTGSEQRLQTITTIITEIERDINIIEVDLVELGAGLPVLSSGLSMFRCR